MNDDELMTLIRGQRGKVEMTTPVESVVRRGRHLQHRRRAAWTGGALAVVAAPVAVLSAISVSTHPGTVRNGITPAPPTRLAAWTVTKEAGGDIDVTIHQLKDPAGLQQTLRRDGVPAVVSSTSLAGGACHAYDGDISQLRAVMQVKEIDGAAHLIIDPVALPKDVGVAIFDDPGISPSTPSSGPANDQQSFKPRGLGAGPLAAPPSSPAAVLDLLHALGGPVAVGLVEVSAQCTG